ncbi:MAG: hypothetical protein GY720_11995 [bacterium]|nr:hypothetical protein [bacterium]
MKVFASLPHDARSDLAAGMARDWRRLAAAGTWWSGQERVAIAAVARAAQAGETVQSHVLSDVSVEAARRLAVEPASTTRDMVARQPDAGMEHAAYVELAGVVSRLSAIDAVHRALGADLEPLPKPEPGEPSRVPQPAQARQGRAFVPMVGGASIVGALSLVPAEMEAQRDIHGPLYMRYEDMDQYDHQGGLHRTQLELVAGRTSAINDCFY